MFERAAAWAATARAETAPPELPAYLEDNYWSAHLRPASLVVFDLIYSTPPWPNASRAGES